MSVLGAIALCVCRHKMCHKCRIVGNPSNHAQHNDIVFGNRGIYFVILFIWLWSFLVISPDAFSITSVFKWSNNIYGCDFTYSVHTSYLVIANIVINLIIIFVSYGIVARYLVIDQIAAMSTMNNPDANIFTKHIKMLFSLSVAYTISVIPALIFSWGMFDTLLEQLIDQKYLQIIRLISNCSYWSMFGKLKIQTF